MNKKIIVTLLVVVTLICGCNNKETLLYRIMIHRYDTPLVIPFYYKKDTIICSMTGDYLYYKWNIKTMDIVEFHKMLYTVISSNHALEVNEEFFSYLKEEQEIKVDLPMLDIYQEKGIEGLINEYLNDYNCVDFSKHRKLNSKYLVYLFFINNYYFYWMDEEPCLHMINPPQ